MGMKEPLKISVFTREETSNYENLSPAFINKFVNIQTHIFLQAMGDILSRKKQKAMIKNHGWPRRRSTGLLENSAEPGYDYLNNSEYDGDIAVYTVPDLHRTDPSVGQLILRENKFLHLCLLSAKPLPEYEDDPDLYRGLLAIPTGARKYGDSRFYVTTLETKEGETPILNPVESGVMTIDDIPSMNKKKIANILDLVEYQKTKKSDPLPPT